MAAPVCIVLVFFLPCTIKRKMLLILACAALGGLGYMEGLTATWEYFNAMSGAVSLIPWSAFPPMMLMLVANAALAAVATERYEDKGEVYDETFDGTTECADSDL